MEEYICKYCGKICKNANSLRNHERLCPSNPDRNYVSYTLGKTAWNKGLTKETSNIVKEQAEKQSKTRTGVPRGPMSEEHKQKVLDGIRRAKAEGKNVGGYRFHKSGHGKKCIYQGIFFDSSWEVAYYVYHTEHGVPLERNTDTFQITNYLRKKRKNGIRKNRSGGLIKRNILKN